MKIKRVLLKLSGEVLGGNAGSGIENDELGFYSNEIKQAVKKGFEVAVVIGGGNIFRGGTLIKDGFLDRVNGDYMGMLATIINGIALKTTLNKIGIKAKLITSFEIDKIGELYNHDKVLKYLDDGYTLIFSGGTSNPYFTTDSAAAMRAIEIEADAIMKGTKVDGVYSADPMKDKNAKKYDKIKFAEAIQKELKVMDLTAFALCKENNKPIYVFKSNVKGNLVRALEKADIGTLVY
ncbi:MAG: UMP kinase [Bacteroidota bacterium]|nr:UMP kinase [Bacteroidota bacterium]